MHHSVMSLPYLQSCSLLFDENGKKWIFDQCILCVFFFCVLARSSFVSVVFDFNASPNDVAPVSLILLAVV